MFFFGHRSRPVAVMTASTVFTSDAKLISLDDKNCTIGRERKQVTCAKVISCLKYNGINLPTLVGKYWRKLFEPNKCKIVTFRFFYRHRSSVDFRCEKSS